LKGTDYSAAPHEIASLSYKSAPAGERIRAESGRSGAR